MEQILSKLLLLGAKSLSDGEAVETLNKKLLKQKPTKQYL